MNPAPAPEWFFLMFVPLFVGIWIAVCVLISVVGGWWQLAQSYRSPGSVTGTSWWFQSASMRLTTSYSRCLTVTVNHEGLGVAVLPLFRVGHPPLFFPWQDVSARRRQGFLGIEQVTFAFAREPSLPLRVSGRLARKIAESVGEVWSEESA